MKVIVAAVTALPFLCGSLQAQDFEQTRQAMELGKLIGSEQYCDLEFDQAAIQKWIDENVDAANMGFSSTLDMGVSAERYSQDDRSSSAKTAHCHAIKRTAAHLGLIGS